MDQPGNPTHDTGADTDAPSPPPTDRRGAAFWLRAGWRVATLRGWPALAGARPTPAQLLAATALVWAMHLGAERLAIPGPAWFDARAEMVVLWATPALLFLAWWCARPRGGSVAAWYLAWVLGTVPLGLVGAGWAVAHGRGALPAPLADNALAAWLVYGACVAGAGAVAVAAGRAVLRAPWWRLAVLGVAVVAAQLADGTWRPERAWVAQADAAEPRPTLRLSQAVFEAQQAAWQAAADALLPGRPGVVDVYGLVFAPYASEDVFLRESNLVRSVLEERFDAAGRTLQLVNHASTAATLPWATPENLRRGIAAIAARMDRDEDVLVLYLTSHGGRDGQLAAWHGPLAVEPATPALLRAALDEAGVRWRVVGVSACYSGSWMAPLVGDGTLVMTAADATHTSYGCGTLSPLTFFGRALWDEQLRATHSFERAYAAAVPVIRQREADAKKPDGFSNPQISTGPAIRPVLQALEARLAR